MILCKNMNKGKTKVLWELLESRLLQYPDSTISDEINYMTYLEIVREVDRISKSISSGQSGTVIGILCNSEFNTAIALMSLLKAKKTAVLLSSRYGENHCRKIIDFIKPSCIITDCPDNSILVNYDLSIYLVNQCRYLKLEQYPAHDMPKDLAAIMCTSGTTGTPKGAMITESNLVNNLLDIEQYFNIKQADSILIARPLYHAAVMTGEFLISILKGVDIRFYNGEFNPVRVIEVMQKYAITVFCATPTLIYHISRIVLRFSNPLPIRVIAVSGECMTGIVAELTRKAFPSAAIYSVYGLTEASPRVSYLPPELFDDHPLSIGYPLQSVSAKIVDDDGNTLAPYKDGELIVAAPSVMLGYYQNAVATSQAIRNGWLHTGDIAYMDDDGLIYIKSRKDAMVIRAGMNIYPQEIENVLKIESGITDALVYGLKDEIVGQKIMLKLVVNNPAISKQEVYEICRQKLPSYQIPDSVEFVNYLEKNGSGKLVRPKYVGAN